MGLFGPPNIEKLKAKNDVRGLIKALKYKKDKCVRERAAYILSEIGDPRAVEPLIAALKDAESYVRQEAANALGKFGDPRAVEPLIISLQGEEGLVRQEAALALGQIGSPRAVEPLIAELKDEDFNRRMNAALALGQIGDPHSMQSLFTALGDDSFNVRKTAAEALQALGWRPDESADGATYWAMMGKWNRCVQIGELAVEPLIFVLVNKYAVDINTRLAVAKALGKIGDSSAVEPLIAALVHWDAEIRLAAAQALGMMGDPRSIIPLISALRDKNDRVQKAASQALRKSSNSQVVEQLITTLKDQDTFIRTSVVKTLSQIGKPAIEPLIAALGNEFWYVREAAAEALEKLRWTPDEGPNGAAYWVTKGNWDRCVKIGTPAVDPLIVALKDADLFVGDKVAQALGEIGEARAVGPLCTALTHEDIKVREAAVEALERFGWQPDEGVNGAAYWIAKQAWDRCVQIGSSALDPLITALGYWPWEVRQAAAEALDKLGWQPDEGPNGASYWVTKGDWDRCVQISAPAVEPLITALGHWDAEIRLAAVQALGKIGHLRAVEPLINALKDKDFSVRKAAAEILVEFYQAGTLSAPLKNLVLENRTRMTTKHADFIKHEDQDPPSDCHFDRSGHHDSGSGIGVHFPI